MQNAQTDLQAARILRTEALSDLSSAIMSCETIADIQQCLDEQLKYVIDFECVRIRIGFNEDKSCLIVNHSKQVQPHLLSRRLQPYETEVRVKGIPKLLKTNDFTGDTSSEVVGPQSSVWVWCFDSKKVHGDKILTTIVVSDSVTYSRLDIACVKTICEIMLTKIHLLSTLQQLSSQNAVQRTAIELSNKELKELNQSLVDTMYHYSHSVREPLTRILSAVQYMEPKGSDMLLNAILTASQDLDEEIKKGIINIERQIVQSANSNR